MFWLIVIIWIVIGRQIFFSFLMLNLRLKWQFNDEKMTMTSFSIDNDDGVIFKFENDDD